MDERVEHCKDCCCAMSWKALGIYEFTGKSIVEHIEILRTSLASREKEVEELKKSNDLLSGKFGWQAYDTMREQRDNTSEAYQRIDAFYTVAVRDLENFRKHHEALIAQLQAREKEIGELKARLEKTFIFYCQGWEENDTCSNVAEIHHCEDCITELITKLEKQLQDRDKVIEGMRTALHQISCGTYSSFPNGYKDLCKEMMLIAKAAINQTTEGKG